LSTDLVPAAETSLQTAVTAAADFIAAAKSKSTHRAYASDWRDFESWCATHRQTSLPADPGTVAAYLSSLATTGKSKASTLRRRCAAIAYRHRAAGHDSPASHPGVKETLAGIVRTIGAAPRKKAALTVDMLAKAARRIPGDLHGLRDRALILLGFAAALRRSELVGLDVEDIQRHPKGLVVTIRRSKTDQTGEGRIKAIPRGRRLKVIEALDAWLAAARIASGPIFRAERAGTVSGERLCDRQVARIVKKRAREIGLDPALFAGHSLRSGFITSADEYDAPLEKTAAHAGHAKLDTTRGYIQVNDAFRNHAGKAFL
jgi:integrase